MDTGWIKLHRKILDNPICKKPNWGWLWVCLLLMANHDENEKFIWNGEVVHLKKGQFITGRKKLHEATKIPESSIEDILRFLETRHQIRQEKTSKYRLITILNWDKYQYSDSKGNNRATTEQQQPDTNKNDKNEEEGKEDMSGWPIFEFTILFEKLEKHGFMGWRGMHLKIENVKTVARLLKEKPLQEWEDFMERYSNRFQEQYCPKVWKLADLEEKWPRIQNYLNEKVQMDNSPAVIKL